uniref:Uncharacterized protein n=1 Tax=Pithovirus LCPAC101 TaxID=2506586 RepID=A0A481Z385_9VIRU|nr:MAG: hypothetical protein LCPAC101_02680 [Pithovirus LCPAC101]
MNVYDLIRLSGVVFNGIYLYNNTNELYEVEIYNIFLMLIMWNLIAFGYSIAINVFIHICKLYLPDNLFENIVKLLKYKFFETDRNKETDVKNEYICSILSTGIDCLFILTNTKLFPEWLHFMCTPLLSTFISLIYTIIKYNFNIANVVGTVLLHYTSYSLALNLPNIIIMTFINNIIIKNVQKISGPQIVKILIFVLQNIGFIPLGIYFYNDPFRLQLIDENEIMNFIVILFSCLVVTNIISIFGLVKTNNSDCDVKSEIYKFIKNKTIFTFIGVMGEEALFLPLYNDWYMYLGMFYTKIILSIIFGLVHIPGRNWKSSIFYIISTFILLQFNFSLINRMVGHYLYDIILFQLFF